MKKVELIIWIQSYNGEKTISRSIQSILDQTYTDFTCYVLDHASIDSTGEVIRSFCAKDKRVVYLHESENVKGIRLKYFKKFLESHGNDALLVTLDDDDCYLPTFLETMLDFLQKNRLDIGFCHSRRIEMHGGYANITLPQTISVDIVDFVQKYFTEYYPCTTTFWKNISYLRNMITCLENVQNNSGIEFNTPYSGGHMIDNLCMLEHLKLVTRVGSLGEFLHIQYVSTSQLSNEYNPGWYANVLHIRERMLDFFSHFRLLNDVNLSCVIIRHLTLLKYIIVRLFKSDCQPSVILNDFVDIFQHTATVDLLKLDFDAVGIRTVKSVFLDWIIILASKLELTAPEQQPLKAHLIEVIENLKREVL